MARAIPSTNKAKRRNKGGDDDDDDDEVSAPAVLVAVDTKESSLQARSRTMLNHKSWEIGGCQDCRGIVLGLSFLAAPRNLLYYLLLNELVLDYRDMKGSLYFGFLTAFVF